MSERLEQILKKLSESTPSSGESRVEKPAESRNGGAEERHLGEENCPICQGLGYIRWEVPLGHPKFGRVEVCECRASQSRQQIFQRLYAHSHLDHLSHLTFENFHPRGRAGLYPQEANSIELAYRQARTFAETLQGWLFLQGGYGCGKTHLAAAIANTAVQHHVPTLFLTVPDLLDGLRSTLSEAENRFEEHFEEIRTVRLLILDDFGTQNATPWAQEKLFQIMNYRYVNRLPTVITTNLRLEQIEGRIRSRLEDPELVTKVVILAPDYRRPTAELGMHEFAMFPKLQRCTFANFDLRKDEGLPAEALRELEAAFRAAREFAQNPLGWIVFNGPSGSGKTHLAAAIHNYRRDVGQPSRFVDVGELLNALRATFSPFSPESLDERFEDVRRAPLLILDDLDSYMSSPWSIEKLYQIIHFRYLAELPTVITLGRLRDQLEPRLLTRIEDRRLCRIYPLSVPSYTAVEREPIKPSRRRQK
ncbi:MAG: ATP-binding protein [Anaerolineales bacterium]|nr:ATP-binding protein [Anaerolineales bacterium]MDW8161712.1 ATP-binding protein [Anaerolineales bacterium]